MRAPADSEAVLAYGPSAYQIVRPGDYVTCAVTGERVPLLHLRYWSVARQEPYAAPEAALQAEQRAASSGA